MAATTAIQAQKPAKKDIFLQLYSVRDDIKSDFNSTLTKVAAMGYTGIEAANYDNGKFYGLTPAAFKNEIEKRGMKVLSSHTGKALNDNISETNWTETWAWWDTAIAAHKAAGMKYIVTPWMPTVKTLADLKAYCDYYNNIGEKCNAAGLRFGYHNHNFEFSKIEGETMYDFMLKNTDPAKVFFQMDVYWVVRGGQSPVDYFNKYPGRFELLHIKDNKELGQSGMVGFDAIFQNTKKEFENLNKKISKKDLLFIENRYKELLKATYAFEDDEDRIYINKDEFLPLNQISSGQQELLPALLILLSVLNSKTSTTIIFEEPEAHLFPKDQQRLVELLIYILNHTQSGNRLIITTHSPYILSVLNNLIYAGKLNSKYIDENLYLHFENISAYSLSNNKAKSILNKENNLIDANYIDDVSNDIANIFDKLLDEEYGE